MTLSEFLDHFEYGRYRKRDGTIEVAFLTDGGRTYPGRLTFAGGLCVAAEIDGGGRWAYPDARPLTELRMILRFDNEPFGILFDEGAIREDRLPVQLPDFSQGVRLSPRARMAVSMISPEVREATTKTLNTLAHTPPAFWPEEVARRSTTDRSSYLVHINEGDEWVALIRLDYDGQIEMRDIALADALRQPGLLLATGTGG